MRKFFRFWMCATLLAALAGAGSCKKDDTANDKKGVTKKTWPVTEKVGDEAKLLSYTFTAAAEWTAASSQPDWCHVLTPSGQAGANELKVDIDPNSTGESRWATVTVSVAGYSPAKFTVKQGEDGSGTTATGVVKTIDEDLKVRYLWNEEYKTLKPDYSIPYTSMSNNFLRNTLLTMKTNTLDKKKQSDGSYSVYSYLQITGEASSYSAAVPLATRAGKVPNHGITPTTTLSYGFVNLSPVLISQTTMEFVVDAVYPGSPAATAGIRRGTEIVKIGGKAIVYDQAGAWVDVLTNLIAPERSGSVVLEDSKGVSYTVSTGAIQENQVLLARVIDKGGRKIAHMVYGGFEAAYDATMIDAFQQFKQAGCTELILDLRMNGGGHVISADLLSSLIGGGHCNDRVFAFYRYNKERMENRVKETKPYDESAGYFYDKFSYTTNYYTVDLKDYALGLDKFYVFTTGNTASASELVINALEGIDVDAVKIGEQSNGKNVGMEGRNLRDDRYIYSYMPITFQTYNAKKFGDYEKGFVPDYKLSDSNFSGNASSSGQLYFEGYRDFTDETEPYLAKALELITGVKPAAKTTRSVPALRGIRVQEPLPEAARRPSGMVIPAPAGEIIDVQE